MSETSRDAFRVPGVASDVFSAVFGGLIVGGFVYYIVGWLNRIDALTGSPIVVLLQWTGAAVVAVAGGYDIFKTNRRRAVAQATAQVKDAFEKKAEETGKSIAEIATDEIAESVQGVKVSEEHKARLVRQEQQRLIIDKETFEKELSSLIVDYLQPLPRNAKRVVNRFRVHLLIAQRRGLLSTQPKVTAQQLGKWLVMNERWPQLSRSLTADPQQLKGLETPAAGGAPPKPDPFMDSIKSLAPFYVGDEDLRRFMQSAPMLAPVLPRLVNYGNETPEEGRRTEA